jgi:hypothetical protein
MKVARHEVPGQRKRATPSQRDGICRAPLDGGLPKIQAGSLCYFATRPRQCSIGILPVRVAMRPDSGPTFVLKRRRPATSFQRTINAGSTRLSEWKSLCDQRRDQPSLQDGTLLLPHFPGTSCRATFIGSLRDNARRKQCRCSPKVSVYLAAAGPFSSQPVGRSQSAVFHALLAPNVSVENTLVVTASPARTALKNSRLTCDETYAYF